jgi:DNA repair protein RecO (recombination protein O)
MTKERLYRTDAIIIRQSDFGEADRLLTVFTPDLGKLRWLAKGVRKITSRKSGHVELFMLTDMLVARGRTGDPSPARGPRQTRPCLLPGRTARPLHRGTRC